MLEEDYTNHAGFQSLVGADAGDASVVGEARGLENSDGAYDLRTPPPGCSVFGRGNAAHKQVEASPLAEGIWHALPMAANYESQHSF